VLAVRSRTTRSSKGKASIILFFSTFLLITFPSFSSFFFDTLTPHPLHPPFSLSYYTLLTHTLPPLYQLLSDPEGNTQQLTEQLRQLGLYAADTTGDGNCLFRALSDQLFGTESRHLQLRKDICDWIQSHSIRYAPFVDDERGLDVHLSLMRQPGEPPHTLVLLLVFLKRPHTRLFIILSHIRWPSRTLRVRAYEEV